MLKALIRQQFAELKYLYFHSKKSGQAMNAKQITGLAVLLGSLAMVCMFAFFGMALLIATNTIVMGYTWFYYSFMGLVTLLVGVIGSVFTTYVSLYRAKDNELLLSMPIPPLYIILSRMVAVWFMSLIYSTIAWLPTMICAWMFMPFTAANVLFPILLWLIIPFFVTVLTSALGWVVALVAGKTGSKTWLTTALTVVLIGGYYVFYFNLQKILMAVVENIDRLGELTRTWLFPIYHLGNAAAGDAVSFVIFFALTAALVALCGWLLSRGFLRLATMKAAEKKKGYTGGALRARTAMAALLGRELRHFTGSSAYLLNGGFGALMLVVAAVAAVIYRPSLAAAIASLAESAPFVVSALPIILVGMVNFICAMDALTSSSVSIEGQSLWILKTMPVTAWDVLRAKERMHVIINATAGELALITVSVVLSIPFLEVLLAAVLLFLLVLISADLGLVFNLKNPNLDWSSEAVPVKQGMPVLLSMLVGLVGGGVYVLIGLGVSAIVGPAAGIGPAASIGPALWLLIGIIGFGLAAFFCRRWLRTTGARLFDAL